MDDVERWLEARNLRNRLIHEYMEDPEQFAEDLLLAESYSLILFDCNSRIRTYAINRMDFEERELPEPVDPDTD